MAPGMRPLIQLRDVWKVYHLGDVEVRALRGVSLDIRAGELLAIIGASGSGKSTCMNLIGCLAQPTRGTYRLGDVDVSTLSVNERAAIRSSRIGFVFQNFNLLGRSTALEHVAVPMIYANVRFAEQRRRARELLAAVGLHGREEHMPSQLSGGQQQRVAIARALANGPSLLLADEPTGNQVERQIRRLLRERHRIPPGQDDDFTVRDLNEIAEASKNASVVMMNLLLSVASVSLLVGGIGIMNIMLVSVTERTREIGVRLALGARSGHILFQFLVEATALSLVGGAAGIVLGIGATRLIAHLAQWPTLLSAPAAAGAFLVAGAIGIFFGFYPARRAARLDPITALRYE